MSYNWVVGVECLFPTLDLISGLELWSDAIRQLGETGWGNSHLRRAVGVRYQSYPITPAALADFRVNLLGGR